MMCFISFFDINFLDQFFKLFKMFGLFFFVMEAVLQDLQEQKRIFVYFFFIMFFSIFKVGFIILFFSYRVVGRFYERTDYLGFDIFFCFLIKIFLTFCQRVQNFRFILCCRGLNFGNWYLVIFVNIVEIILGFLVFYSFSILNKD